MPHTLPQPAGTPQHTSLQLHSKLLHVFCRSMTALAAGLLGSALNVAHPSAVSPCVRRPSGLMQEYETAVTLLLDACNKLARLEFERVGALRDMKRAMAARRNALHKIIVHASLPTWPALHSTPTRVICTNAHTLASCLYIMISHLQGGADPLSAQYSKLREMLTGHTQEAEERVFASVASSHSGAGAADGEDEEGRCAHEAAAKCVPSRPQMLSHWRYDVIGSTPEGVENLFFGTTGCCDPAWRTP